MSVSVCNMLDRRCCRQDVYPDWIEDEEEEDVRIDARNIEWPWLVCAPRGSRSRRVQERVQKLLARNAGEQRNDKLVLHRIHQTITTLTGMVVVVEQVGELLGLASKHDNVRSSSSLGQFALDNLNHAWPLCELLPQSVGRRLAAHARSEGQLIILWAVRLSE